eukprot:UN24777
MDKDGTEISCSAFNNEAERIFNILQLNKVYAISKGRIKPNTYQKGRVKHNYAINCNRETTFQLLANESAGKKNR